MIRFILIFLFLPSLLFADVKTIECTFMEYSNKEGLHKNKEPFILTFIIDEESKTSYMKGNQGTTKVHMVKSSEGISFIEVTDFGNVMLTTISNGKAVHSRHTLGIGDMIPSQNYGTYKTK